MSSPVSPAPVDYRDALLAAVSDVAENSLFAFADASDQATYDAAATAPLLAGGSEWIDARIEFRGSIAGRFSLRAPEPLARHLCASFAGAETPDEITQGDLIDFTGELANMICGAWLTRAYRHEAFSLMPPQVQRRRPGADTTGDADADRFYLTIDEAPIRLGLHWESVEKSAEARADGR